MTRWFTSDTHFGHRLVAGHRGFWRQDEFNERVPDTVAHDEALIRNINDVVHPDDVVFHLGDVGLCNEKYMFQCVLRLLGTWHLIAGNHDKVWPGHRGSQNRQVKWLRAFDSVQAFGRMTIGAHELLMSHFPYEGDHTEEDRETQFRLRDEGQLLLCGHTHSKVKWNGPRQIHVGLDAWNLRPVSEFEILALLNMDEKRRAR